MRLCFARFVFEADSFDRGRFNFGADADRKTFGDFDARLEVDFDFGGVFVFRAEAVFAFLAEAGFAFAFIGDSVCDRERVMRIDDGGVFD